MMMKTNAITPKKIAIVTGGSRGIGRSTVESLAKRGVNTIFTYHTHGADSEAVVGAVNDAGSYAVALQLDAGNIASFDAFVGSVKDALSNLGATRFDFLVNNAGNNHRNMPFEKATEEEFDSVLSVHFKGVFFLTGAKAVQGGGKVTARYIRGLPQVDGGAQPGRACRLLARGWPDLRHLGVRSWGVVGRLVRRRHAWFEGSIATRGCRAFSSSGVGRRSHDRETAGQAACTDAVRACPWCQPFRVTAGTDI